MWTFLSVWHAGFTCYPLIPHCISLFTPCSYLQLPSFLNLSPSIVHEPFPWGFLQNTSSRISMYMHRCIALIVFQSLSRLFFPRLGSNSLQQIYSFNWNSHPLPSELSFPTSYLLLKFFPFLVVASFILSSTTIRWWSEPTSALLFALTSWRELLDPSWLTVRSSVWSSVLASGDLHRVLWHDLWRHVIYLFHVAL